MKRAFYLIVFLIVLPMLHSGCTPRQYSPEDLQRLNAKKENGVVVQQSRGSFVLRTNAGEEAIYRTGELTQYIPEGYRSLKGDQVQVTYQEMWERSGKIKSAVLQLEAIFVPDENQPLSNPLEGVIVFVDRGSSQYAKAIYLKESNQEEALPLYFPTSARLIIGGKSISTENFNYDELIDKNAKITSTRKPILRGNGYIYVIDELIAH